MGQVQRGFVCGGARLKILEGKPEISSGFLLAAARVFIAISALQVITP
jgi:hypothetical protein